MSPVRILIVPILIGLAACLFGCPMQESAFFGGELLAPGEDAVALEASGDDALDLADGAFADGADPRGPSGDGSPSDCAHLFPCPGVLPYGVWVLKSGSMLPNFITGLATFTETADVTALILNSDGTGRVFFRDRLTGAKDCVRTLVVFDGRTLVLDFSAETTTDFEFNIAIENATFFFPVVELEESTLGLADEQGNIGLFVRRNALPPGVVCEPLQVVDRFEGLPDPQFFSDLVLFNGDLIFNSGLANQIEAFDLDTDTLIAPLGPTGSRLVQTSEDGFLWTHCGCGGSRDAFKRTLSTVVDTVESETEMGGPITFRAMAYVPTTDRLWIHGRSFADSFGRFYVVNTNGEPDFVEQTFSFNRDLRALAFDGTHLWGIATIASQTVVKIDPATAQVVESYELPDENVSWSGLEVEGGHIYMLGTDLAGEGVVVRLIRP